jgi:hypothetical protein
MLQIKKMRFLKKPSILILTASLLGGCGYTTGSLLPSHIKSIYVDNFTNSIPITEEATDRTLYKTYRPRLELDITKAVIDKYIFDGHLKIAQKQNADIVLEGSLVNFRREPTKYGESNTIDQYRIAIMVNMKLTDVKNNKVMWEENNFAGSDYYYTSGPQAKSESNAVTAAIDDLARRVVERTVEVW